MPYVGSLYCTSPHLCGTDLMKETAHVEGYNRPVQSPCSTALLCPTHILPTWRVGISVMAALLQSTYVHAHTDSVVWILGVHHGQIRPGCAEIRAPFQYNVHVAMIRTDLCVLAPSLCECQQSVLGCEQQGGDAEAVVAPFSRLEDFSLNNVAGQSCVFTVSGDTKRQ